MERPTNETLLTQFASGIIENTFRLMNLNAKIPQTKLPYILKQWSFDRLHNAFFLVGSSFYTSEREYKVFAYIFLNMDREYFFF